MVKQRGEAWQVDFRWKSQRIRRSFDTEVQAKLWEAQAQERLEKGLPLEEVNVAAADGWTMDTLADAVEARYWKGTANEVNAARNADEVITILGKTRHPRDITASDVDRVMAVLAEKSNSSATINRKLAALSKMLRHAQSRGIIDRMPAIERKREKEGRLRWYTPEEEARVLKHLADKQDFKDLIVFLADTGCRLSEALRIQARDVDQVHARFHGTKNGKARAVPLTGRLRELTSRRREGLNPTDQIFPKDWDIFKARRQWDRVCEALGIEDKEAVLHAWRHTCASRLVQNGVGIQVVQQWLGHKTLTQTLRYAHLAPLNLHQAVAVLEKAVTMRTDKVRCSEALG
jgi:integrase